MDKWDGPKYSMGVITAGEVEISGKPEEEPEDMTGLLRPHNKTEQISFSFLFFKEFLLSLLCR